MAKKMSENPTIECGGCDQKWSGLTRCHCGGCHETFAGLGAFDLHRTYNTCRPPAERGLEFVEGLWRERERVLANAS